MSILARLRARCPGPGGEYQVGGDDLDALLRLGEAVLARDAAFGRVLEARATVEDEREFIRLLDETTCAVTLCIAEMRGES